MAIGNYRNFTNEIVRDYESGVGFNAILREYHVDYLSVKKILLEHNVKIKPSNGKRYYAINENFFECLDSHEKAYFLGYLWADGNNRFSVKTGKGSGVRIELSAVDINILEYFQRLIFYDIIPDLTYSSRGEYIYRSLYINSAKISKDLFALGMNGQKSAYSKIPDVPDPYMNSFVLGYFDGDGSIFKKSDGGYGINITSEKSIITDLKNVIFRLSGVNLKMAQCNNDKSYMIRTSEFCKIYTLYKFMYRDQKTFLKRKHDRFISYFENSQHLLENCDNITPLNIAINL